MGVFWSGTDDRARKDLNDGRTAAFAIVTAYKGDDITYKGCLNFYRPFPLELDAEMYIEESPELVSKSKTIDFDAIKNNMDYSLMQEFLGNTWTDAIKSYYNNELHPTYVKFASDELTLEKVLASDKYDDLLLEAERDTFSGIREVYQAKQKQLKDNIQKPTTLLWGFGTGSYSYPTYGTTAYGTTASGVSTASAYPSKYESASLWSEVDAEYNGYAANRSSTYDDSYVLDNRVSNENYMQGMAFAPEYEPPQSKRTQAVQSAQSAFGV